MSSETLSPRQTLVIMLGAKSWPLSPDLGSSESFGTSARDIREFFLGSEYFNLPRDSLLDLFDTDGPPAVIDSEIERFLKSRLTQLKYSKSPAKNLIVYYIGHGGFTGQKADYYLSIRKTRKDGEGASSIRVADLAKTLTEGARHLRRYIILDSCFSAAAYDEFMGPPLSTARLKTLEAFPPKGTALLCASGPRDPGKAPKGQEHTMFSGALIDVLCNGNPGSADAFSLRDLGDLVRDRIREKYDDDAVRPEVHSPNMKEGDIADIPMFVNRAVGAPDAGPTRILEDIAPSTKTNSEADDKATSEEPGRSLPLLLLVMSAYESWKRHGLSKIDFSIIPPDAKGELVILRQSRFFGFVWLAISIFICINTFVLAFVDSEVNTYVNRFQDSWLVWFLICISMTLVSLASSTFAILRSKTRSFLEKSNVPLASGASPPKWENFPPIISLRASKSTIIVGDISISSIPFAVSTLLYVITSAVFSTGLIAPNPVSDFLMKKLNTLIPMA